MLKIFKPNENVLQERCPVSSPTFELGNYNSIIHTDRFTFYKWN
jgi:hypothetical protein